MVSGKNIVLFEILAVFEIVNIAAAMLINLLLIGLILTRSSREIGAYRYFLLAFALNDIYFPVVHLLTLPVICSYKDAFLMFSHGIFTSTLSACVFACAFSQTMPLLAHLFVYRLIATKWPSYLHFYTGITCFVLITITLSVKSLAWFANCYCNYGTDTEMFVYVQPFLAQEFNGEKPELIGALYYSTEGEFRMRAFLATMGFNGMMAVSMFVIVFSSSSIVVHFRSVNVEWSGATKKLQQQLFHTLVVQMIIPMVFVYFPCAAIINLPLMGFRINVFPNLVSAAVTIFPLIDAFVVLFGVSSYRNAILILLKCKTIPVIRINTTINGQTKDTKSTVFTRTQPSVLG